MSYVDATTVAVNAANGSLTIPATTQGQDYLILRIYRSANEAIPTLSGTGATGFAQIGTTQQASSLTCYIFAKFAAGTVGSTSSEAGNTVTITLSISPTAGRFVGILSARRGIDTTTPIDAITITPFTTGSGSATHTTPTVTAVNGGEISEGVCNKPGASAETNHVAPAGVTKNKDVYSGAAAGPAAAIGTVNSNVSAGGSAGGHAWTCASGISSQYIVDTIVLRLAAGTSRVNKTHAVSWNVAALALVVTGPWPGGQGQTTASVTANTSGATSVRLAYSTDSGMASPSYVAAQTPDAQGNVKFAVTGLSPGTTYYFQCADTPSGGSESLIGPIAGPLKTLYATGTPIASLKFLIGGCIRTGGGTNSGLQGGIDWGTDRSLLNGDLTYSGTTSTTASVQAQKILDQLIAVPKLNEFVRKGCAQHYIVSDHDDGVTDNGDSNTAFNPANIVAYKTVTPHGVLNDTGGTTASRDQQWDEGRYSFFQIDVRNTDRSTGSGTDNSSKTMLGAAQLARLLAWLDAATPAVNPALFILGDTQWMGAADIVNKQDWWPAYTFERDTIITHIAAAQARGCHVEYWHGDAHLIGYATSVKNTWGSFPVLCAAPYDQDGGGRNTSTFSAFFNNSSAAAAEYGKVTLTDVAGVITRTFSGWDAISNTEKVSNVEAFTPLTRVTKTHAVSYNVAARVPKTHAVSYNVAARVAKTLAASWNVSGRVTKTHAASWNVAGRVTMTLPASWNLGGRASKTHPVSWDVAVATTRVAKTHAVSFDVRARVPKTQVASWNVAARVAKTHVVSFDVRARASKTHGVSWNVAVLAPAAVQPYVSDGSTWVPCLVYVSNGTAWMAHEYHTSDGSAWH